MWFRETADKLATSIVALGVVLVTSTPLVAAQEAAGSSAGHNWRVERESQTLPDSSELTSYTAVTRALSPSGEQVPSGQAAAQLQVSFHPRFDCSPAITLSFPANLVGKPPADDTLLPVLLDGQPLAWPVVVDTIDDRVSLAFVGTVDTSDDVIRKLDIANRAKVGLEEGGYLAEFSLLGSRVSVREARRQCRYHQPREWVRPVKSE